MSEINGLKNPEGAEQKFHLMIGGPDIVQPFLDVLATGLTDDNDDVGELFRKYLDHLLVGVSEEGDKSGS